MTVEELVAAIRLISPRDGRRLVFTTEQAIRMVHEFIKQHDGYRTGEHHPDCPGFYAVIPESLCACPAPLNKEAKKVEASWRYPGGELYVTDLAVIEVEAEHRAASNTWYEPMTTLRVTVQGKGGKRMTFVANAAEYRQVLLDAMLWGNAVDLTLAPHDDTYLITGVSVEGSS